jgi:hypothetical protein
MYNGLKSLLGIQIPVGFDLDLFGPIQTFERALTVCSVIFHPHKP